MKREKMERKTSVWTEYERANLSISDENTSIKVQAERELLDSV